MFNQRHKMFLKQEEKCMLFYFLGVFLYGGKSESEIG